ncbi:MAG: GDSL-type esterase/lipase family protein [Lentisphaeraceae bacterium]|nr:GDSL-type esterase/lipase family protein [Lentisphaeraceae bacterium]
MKYFLILLLTSTILVADQKPIYILPLGDSITQGGKTGRNEFTYRYPLFCKLKDSGVNFDFIGSLKTGLHKDAKWPNYKDWKFDHDHEGHYGWKTQAILDKLPSWSEKYKNAPDIALIHLGTNDQKSKKPYENIAKPLEGIINHLRSLNPKVVVLVGHLNFNSGDAVKIRTAVEKMAKKVSTKSSPVVTVHMYENWQPNPKKTGADTFDWAHPNEQGQEKMAVKWFDAMQPYLKK